MLRDARLPPALARQLEDLDDDGRLLGVGLAPDGLVDAFEADVAVAVDRAAGHQALLEAGVERAVDAPPRVLVVLFVLPRADHRRDVVRAELLVLVHGPDVDAVLGHLADEHELADRVAAQAGPLPDDHVLEGRLRERGAEPLVAGPLDPLLARDLVVGIDVPLVQLPPVCRRELLDLVGLLLDRLQPRRHLPLHVRLPDVRARDLHVAVSLHRVMIATPVTHPRIVQCPASTYWIRIPRIDRLRS